MINEANTNMNYNNNLNIDNYNLKKNINYYMPSHKENKLIFASYNSKKNIDNFYNKNYMNINKDNYKNDNNKNNIVNNISKKYTISGKNEKYLSINKNKYKNYHNENNYININHNNNEKYENCGMNDNKNNHINNNNYISINNKKNNNKCFSINKNNNFDNAISITFNKNKIDNISINDSKKINITTNIHKLLDDCCIPKFEENEYKDIRELGHGAFGKINLVKDIKTEQEFALKQIFSRDDKDCKEKIKKLESLYKLENDNIIKLYKINITNNPYSTFIINILMEKAENDWDKEIKNRIKTNQFYTELEILVILKQLISGLFFLQKNNIAHRDVKPQNILIFEKKSRFLKKTIYKIADLGEAKDYPKNKKEHTLIGSELFMSPLVYNGFRQNKRYIIHNPFKSDVYSLGLCFVYAICLNLDAVKNIREMKYKENITKNIESKLKINYSPRLMNIIYKMIEYEENNRYDFEQLEKELEKISYLKFIK